MIPARKSAIMPVDRLGLAQVDHLHIVRRAARQDEGHVAGRFPSRLTPGRHGLKIENRKSHEFDQGDSLGQVQGHGAAVGGPELLLQVHLGDLSGQLRLQPFSLGIPLGESLQVRLETFRSRTRERLASDLHAQGGELAQPRFQSRILAPQQGVALGGHRLGRDGLPPQHQLESGVDRIGRIAEVLQNQGQEGMKLVDNRIEERSSLPLGADREDLSDHPVIDGRGLFHQRHCLRRAARGRIQHRQVVQAGGVVRVVLAQRGAVDLQCLAVEG